MAFNLITSWQIDGETVDDFIFFLDSKITADGDCSLHLQIKLNLQKLKDAYSLEGKL